MTIHVIDQSRPVPPTYEPNQPGFSLGRGDVLLLAAGAEIAAYGSGSEAVSGNLDTTLVINGRVHSELGSGLWGQGSTINIGTSGTVHGGRDYGICLVYDWQDHTPNALINAGMISGIGTGILLESGQNTITNTGTITGSTGIDAVIWAGYEPSSLSIANTGLIRGTDETAIYGYWYFSTNITNKGRIEGNIVLGTNADIYDGRGGTAMGVIFLGDGDDTAYGGNGSETFIPGPGRNFIDGGDGIDTIQFTFGTLWRGAWHKVDLRETRAQQTSVSSWDTIVGVENLIGANVSDQFIGNTEANTLVGNGGNDTLDGYDGNDLLSGGAGNDLLVGGTGSDTAVFSGRFYDYTIVIGADGVLRIADNRFSNNDGTDQLTGVEFALFNDMIFTLPTVSSTPAPTTPAPNPTGPFVPTPGTPSMPVDASAPLPAVAPSPAILAPAKNLSFRGGKKGDTFAGEGGHDYLNGGLGNDTLTGGGGQDTFAFSGKLGAKNVDLITDFEHADDSISLSKAVFAKIQKGMLTKGAFWIGAQAHDRSDRIIYNDKTGTLSYDADGTGTKYAAIKFAQLKAGTLLMADDIFIM